MNDVAVQDDYRTHDTINMAGRFVAVVAAAVPTVIGLIALAKFTWSGVGATGLDSPAVRVAGMWFRPWVAIATVAGGLIAMAAAASWDRASKLFVGAILVAVGIAIVLANPTVEAIPLNNRMGWMAIIVGAVLAIVGLLTARPTPRRTVRSRDVQPVDYA